MHPKVNRQTNQPTWAVLLSTSLVESTEVQGAAGLTPIRLTLVRPLPSLESLAPPGSSPFPDGLEADPSMPLIPCPWSGEESRFFSPPCRHSASPSVWTVANDGALPPEDH